MRGEQPLHVQRTLALHDYRPRDAFERGAVDARAVDSLDDACVKIAPHLTPRERAQLNRLADRIRIRYERETQR